MKKVVLALLGLLLGTSVWAQKQSAGNITVEYLLDFSQLGLFTPGNGQPYSVFNHSLRLRYFINEGLAIRTHLGINGNKVYEEYPEKQDGTGNIGTREAKYNRFTIGVGGEKHFEGTEKLSPFVGLEFLFSTQSASETWDKYDGTSYNANFSRNFDGSATINNTSYIKGNSIQIGPYLGFDYYFLPNLYIGTELSLLFSSTKNSDVTITTTINNQSTTVVQKGSRSSGFITSALGFFRFGFIIK